MTYSVTDRLTDGVLWRRVTAWLIDAVLIGLIMSALWLGFITFGVLTLGLSLPLLGLLPLVPFAYLALFIAGGGCATPGQGVMGLTVREVDTMARPTLVQAAVFTVGLWITLGAGVVWLVAALFLPQKRAIHDLVSGLVVVRSQALTHAPAFGTIG